MFIPVTHLAFTMIELSRVVDFRWVNLGLLAALLLVAWTGARRYNRSIPPSQDSRD